MIIIYLVGFILLSMMFVWADYLAMMHLKTFKKQGKIKSMHWLPKGFAYTRLFIFAIEDVLFNWTVGTILFLEIPKETLFTTRVSRLNDGNGWRGKLAKYFCREFLDPFDPAGHHCD